VLEVARLLKLSRAKAYALLKTGDIRGFCVGSQPRASRAAYWPTSKAIPIVTAMRQMWTAVMAGMWLDEMPSFTGGDGWESNPPVRSESGHNGFEVGPGTCPTHPSAQMVRFNGQI